MSEDNKTTRDTVAERELPENSRGENKSAEGITPVTILGVSRLGRSRLGKPLVNSSYKQRETEAWEPVNH